MFAEYFRPFLGSCRNGYSTHVSNTTSEFLEFFWVGKISKLTAVGDAGGVLHLLLPRLEESCEGQEDYGQTQRRQNRVARVAVVVIAVAVGDHDVLRACPGVALARVGLGLLQPAAASHRSHFVLD